MQKLFFLKKYYIKFDLYFLFYRFKKVKDIFRENQDYCQSSEYLEKFNFGEKKFSIKDLYQYFY